MRERDQRHDPAVVGQLHVDVPLVAEPVVRLETGEADRGRFDQDVRRVDRGDAGPLDQLVRADDTQLEELGPNRSRSSLALWTARSSRCSPSRTN